MRFLSDFALYFLDFPAGYIPPQFLLPLALMMSFTTSILRIFGKMHQFLVMIFLGSLLLLILTVKLGVSITIKTLKVGVSIAGSLQIPLFHFYLLLLIYLHCNKFGRAFLVLIKAGVREGFKAASEEIEWASIYVNSNHG